MIFKRIPHRIKKLWIIPLISMHCAFTQTPTVDDISTLNADGYWQAKLKSATVTSGPFIDASFLYLLATLDGLQYGQKLTVDASGAPFNPVFIDTQPLRLSYDWNPGVRVGLGYTVPKHEHWQFGAYWTYLHSNADGSSKQRGDIVNQFIVSTWGELITGATNESGEAHWKMNLNFLDFVLSRHTFFGSWLSLKPQAGIRVAWIDQHYTAKYKGGFAYNELGQDQIHFAHTSMRGIQESSGGGLRVGAASEWHLTRNLSIIGDLFGSFIYGPFDIEQTYKGAILIDFGLGPALLDERVSFDKKISRISPILESEIGIKWNKFFHGRESQLSIGAFYQFAVWFNQNRFVREYVFTSRNPINSTARNNEGLIADVNSGGNLQLQGLRLQARYDF